MVGSVMLAVAFLATWTSCYAVTTLHIGVLLPIEKNPRYYTTDVKDTCTMALRDVNISPYILPNHELVMHLNDSKCDVGRTIYQMSDLLQSRKENIVALIGEGCSTVTKPIASATPLWNLPLFNFLSTSPALYNTEAYPHYYPVVPSENGLNPARVAVMKQFRWTKAVILFQPSEHFNLNAKNLRDTMEDSGFETPEFVLLPLNRDYTSVVRQVKESGIRILFGLFYEDIGREIICECLKEGISAPDYVWNFVGWYQFHDWYLDTLNDKQNHSGGCTLEQMETAVHGHLTYDFAHVRRDGDKTVATGKNVTEIATELQTRLKSPPGSSLFDTFRRYSAYGYDCVLAVALSLHKIAEQLNATGGIDRLNNFTYDDDILLKKFHDVITDRTFVFEGLTGPVRVGALLSPEETQKHAAGHVEIRYNIKNASYLVAMYNNQTLSFVRSMPWTTTDESAPYDSEPNVKKYSSIGIFIPIVLLAAIGIVIDLVLLINNRRNTQQMSEGSKQGTPLINSWLILGTAGIFLAVIFYGFDGQFFQFRDPSSLRLCYARTIFLALGFTFGFGSILVRTLVKLHKLLNWQFLKDVDKSLMQYVLIGILAMIDVVLLILWMQLNPWRKGKQILGTDSSDKFVYIRERCSGGDDWANAFIIYKLFVLVVTIVVLVIRINKSDKEKRHGPYKDLIVSGCGLGFASAAFGLIFIDDPGVEYGLVSVMFLILSYSILGALAGMKRFGILSSKMSPLFHKENAKTTDELMKEELRDSQARLMEQKTLLERIQDEVNLVGDLAQKVHDILTPSQPSSPVGAVGEDERQF